MGVFLFILLCRNLLYLCLK